jgi:hypothetical protein
MPMKTLKELAKEALQVQDASNLSGVVHGWHRAITDLCEILRGDPEFSGTDEINHHPINKLWASKVHDLTQMGTSDIEAWKDAYDECKRLSMYHGY